MSPFNSRFATLVLLVASVLSLPGCLLSRIQTMQEQACHFDQNFRLADDGNHITFLKPTLRYDDVAFLAGVSPKLTKLTHNRYLGSYTIRKIGDPAFADIPVRLEFVKHDQQLLLAAASVDSLLLPSPTPKDLTQAAGQACETRLPRWSTRLEFALPEFDPSEHLSKQAILGRLGRPSATAESENTLSYQFALRGADSEELIATLQLEYAPDDETLLRTQTQFYHYLAGTDLVLGRAWGTVTL